MTEQQTTTVQLRRYRLQPDRFDDYLAWWRQHIPGLRAASNFTIEFAVTDAAHYEFLWAVSCVGDIEDFQQLEERYMALPQRLEVFEGVADWVENSDVRFVDLVAVGDVRP